MQLSVKQKKIFSSFCCISETLIKFWTFWKKDDPHSFCISEITDSKIVVR